MPKTGFNAVRWMQQRPRHLRGGHRSQAVLAPEAATPLEQYAASYMDYLVVLNRTPAAVKSRAVDIRFFLAWARERGLQTPGEVTATNIEAFQRWVWEYRQRSGHSLSISTQRARLGGVGQLFQWLCRRQGLAMNPAALIELPRLPKRLPADVLGVNEVQRLMRQPDVQDRLGFRDRTMLEVLYATGIRRAELAALEVSDVALERYVVWVRQGKGRKDRVVPLGRRAGDWVRRYLKDVRPLLARGDGAQALFLSGYGEALNVDVLGRTISGYIGRLKRKGGCHMLRRSCATHMLDGGGDIRHIQKLLGHEKLETTALYAEVSIVQLIAVHAKCHPSEHRYRGTQEAPIAPLSREEADEADLESWISYKPN